MELNVFDFYNRIGWKPHKAQRKVLASDTRMRVVSAGRRFGKSEIGGHELCVEALATRSQANELKLAGKRREFWVVGPEYSDSEKEFRILWNTLNALEVPFDRPGSYNDPIQGNLHLSLWGGSFQVHAKSAKHPETLVGEGLRGVILAEAAKLKQSVWFKYIRPTLADFGGTALMTSTPEGKNWFYDMWRLGQDPTVTEWMSWRFPAWRNPYVYRTPTNDTDVDRLQMMLQNSTMSAEALAEGAELQIDREIIGMLQDLTSESFNQEIGADFTEFVGRVFKDFDEEYHVGDLRLDPKWDTVAAVDYGFTNPNVWLLIQVSTWGDINILGEVYKSGLTTPEFAAEIAARGLCPSGLRTFYPDPADPGATRQMESKLKVRHSGGTGGELAHRLDTIRRALKRKHPHLPWDHPENRPVLMIDRSCVNTIREFQEYRYPEQRETAIGNEAREKPMKKDDHAPEALGRFFAGHFGTDAIRSKRARVRQVEFVH